MKSWYAIYTNPRAEKKVAAALEQKGIEVYLPSATTIKQWSDRKKKVEEVLFKSYAFVCIHMEVDRLSVLATPGVVKFVRIGGEVPAIRQEIIDAIRLSLAHYTEYQIEPISLKPQQAVTVIGGPLKGHIGKVIEQHGQHYFAVQLSELSLQLLVKIPAHHLQPI